MRQIYYNSDITPQAANELKLLALYYDKITIVNDAVYSPKFDQVDGEFKFIGVEDLQFIPPTFIEEYKLLFDEGILDITKRGEQVNDPYEELFSKKISEIVNSCEDYVFPDHPTEPNGKIITEEVYHVMKYMLGFEWGKPIERNYIWCYYAFKLKWFLKLLIEGENCISSSNNLNHLFAEFIKYAGRTGQYADLGGESSSLAFDALKYSLPNPEDLSFDEILELKLKLKDELRLFSQTINVIEVKNKELLTAETSGKKYQALFHSEIEKPLKSFKANILLFPSAT
ncbi:hypothetical protein [Olivibacter oleidegradans]|uniref:Uncharacterized protein n=1 Tax=Olivibacter oleidegradans TaxID=760123 RepID=A0ABV6HPC8_9SPHI